MLTSLSSLEEWDRLSSDETREVERGLPLFRKILSSDEKEFLEEESRDKKDDDEDEATVKEKEELRRRQPVIFRGLQVFCAGDQEHEIATFSFSEEKTPMLLLIPGGNISLGYSSGMYEDFPSQEDSDHYNQTEHVQRTRSYIILLSH